MVVFGGTLLVLASIPPPHPRGTHNTRMCLRHCPHRFGSNSKPLLPICQHSPTTPQSHPQHLNMLKTLPTSVWQKIKNELRPIWGKWVVVWACGRYTSTFYLPGSRWRNTKRHHEAQGRSLIVEPRWHRPRYLGQEAGQQSLPGEGALRAPR